VALKTRNFFLNVFDPSDHYPVTIDGHMLNVWTGKPRNLVGLAGLSERLYYEIADGIRELAWERKLIPNQIQGILWTAWKRTYNLKFTPQVSFWDDHCLAIA
jgi:hypothetical protein